MRKVYLNNASTPQRLNASTPLGKRLRKPKKKICHLVLFFSFHGVGVRALIYDSQLELEKDGRRKTQDITRWLAGRGGGGGGEKKKRESARCAPPMKTDQYL